MDGIVILDIFWGWSEVRESILYFSEKENTTLYCRMNTVFTRAELKKRLEYRSKISFTSSRMDGYKRTPFQDAYRRIFEDIFLLIVIIDVKIQRECKM